LAQDWLAIGLHKELTLGMFRSVLPRISDLVSRDEAFSNHPGARHRRSVGEIPPIGFEPILSQMVLDR